MNQYGDITAALQSPSQSSFEAVTEASTAWNNFASVEEQFFQQKPRITWLRAGDHNTSFFHRATQTELQKMPSNAL